jgi:hypothetical protein
MEEALSPRESGRGLLGPLGQMGTGKHKSPVQLSHLSTGKQQQQHHPVERVEEGSSEESALERQDSAEQLIKAGTTLSSSPTFSEGFGSSPSWPPGVHQGKKE